MNKLISTIILAAFAAVYSFGAVAADTSNKDNKPAGKTKYDSPKEWKEEYGKGGRGNDSTSQIMQNEEPKDVSPDEKYKFRDQEVMNKKPYKQPQ